MSKKIGIAEYLKIRTAHANCSYQNGAINYDGRMFSWQEFDKTYPIDRIEIVGSRNNRLTNENPDKTKVP